MQLKGTECIQYIVFPNAGGGLRLINMWPVLTQGLYNSNTELELSTAR